MARPRLYDCKCNVCGRPILLDWIGCPSCKSLINREDYNCDITLRDLTKLDVLEYFDDDYSVLDVLDF